MEREYVVLRICDHFVAQNALTTRSAVNAALNELRMRVIRVINVYLTGFINTVLV